MIKGVDHAQITVPPGMDGKAREFYCDFLGLREIDKPDNLKKRGGFWLELGNAQVHVGIEEGFDPNVTKNHIAYRVKDIASMRKKLAERGITTQEGLPIPKAERFEFRDPFGNRVEFIERS